LDPTSDPLEVGPAQHYLTGGIRIDDNGASTVPGLFAAGEVTGGVHGAGRLAGNSGTDVLVFGARAGFAAGRLTHSQLAPQPRPDEVTDQAQEFLSLDNPESPGLQELDNITADLGHVMWKHAGLTRNQGSLAEALQRIQSLDDLVRGFQIRNLECQVRLSEMENRLLLAKMICETAHRRQESRGVHYRSDFTERNDLDWMKNIVIRQVDGKIHTRFITPWRRFVDIEPV
jgi:succinate dehydrogenase/fumarate reductase flavoprotein subunit